MAGTALAAVVVYGLGDLISGLLYQGYSFQDQAISELTAFGSPVRPLMLTAMIVHGLLLLAFAVALWRLSDRVILRWTAGLFIAAWIIGLPDHTVWAMSSRWMEPGVNDTMHQIGSLLWVLLMAAAIVLSAVAFKGRFRVYALITFAAFMGFGAAAGVAIRGIEQNVTPWAGGFERISAYAYFMWVIVFAMTATRRSLGQAARQLPARSGSIVGVLRRHTVVSYYALVFAISWGLGLIAVGPGAFIGEPPKSSSEMSFAYGILGPLVAGIAMTLLVSGKRGLGELRRRLLTWRVGVTWYAVALLTAPVLTVTLLLVLSLISPAFTPVIFTTDDKATLVAMGIAIGLVVPIFEETGWTGFVIPQLRKDLGIAGTGVLVGLLWGLWHLPMFASGASSSTVVPPVVYIAVLLFSWLVPYRVLMVWVYDRTKSLLLVMAMHLAIDFDVLVLVPHGPEVALVFDLLLGAALWATVTVVLFRRHAFRPEKSERSTPQSGLSALTR